MPSEQEKRSRLFALRDSVLAFFESTSIHRSQTDDPWMTAFRGVRRNDYLAESFVTELRALLTYIEQEFDPRGAPAASRPSIHDEATRITRIPVPSAPAAPAPPVRAAPKRPPDSELFDDSETPVSAGGFDLANPVDAVEEDEDESEVGVLEPPPPPPAPVRIPTKVAPPTLRRDVPLPGVRAENKPAPAKPAPAPLPPVKNNPLPALRPLATRPAPIKPVSAPVKSSPAPVKSPPARPAQRAPAPETYSDDKTFVGSTIPDPDEDRTDSVKLPPDRPPPRRR